MSLRRKFNPHERHAMWVVNGKICYYCDTPLTYKEIELEHILPISLFETKPDDLKLIKSEYDLPDDFEPNDFLNLALACRKCNSKKSNINLSKKGLYLALGIAKRNKSKVLQHLEMLKKQDEKDNFHFKVSSALNSGKISEHELSKILSESKSVNGVFNLSSPFKLFGNLGVREISNEKVEEYLDSVAILPDWWSDGLELDNDTSERKIVKTLREYQTAISQGFYPLSNAAMKAAYSIFEQPLQILKYLENSTYADVSFIDNPRLGVVDVNFLPASLLCSFKDYGSEDDLESKRLESKTIGDLIESGEAIISRVSSGLISIHWENNWTVMYELMRADFNGDGLQELLINWGGGPVDGTLSMGSVLALARKDENSNFYIMK